MSLANYEERANDFGNPNWVAYQTIVHRNTPLYADMGADHDPTSHNHDSLFYYIRELDWSPDRRDGRF